MTYTGSIRCEGDTWDPASSVGATATMVAAARAMATRAANPLINDQFAEPLVRAVGVDVLTRLASGELTASDIDDPERPNASMVRMAEHHAVRTKFFDEFFMDATRAGIRQVVILASGLDSRAYRLAWPAQTVVYEIDQPQVMEFKTRTLAELGATPTADRRVVTADLRADWSTALGAAGFDPTQPTAWSAEGLLRYLPPEAQDRLLDNVTALSVPDSRFATESIRNFKPHHEERMRERMTILANRWRAYGFDLDMNELVYFGDRNEPASYLSDNGWLLTEIKSQDLLTANGFQPFEDEEVPLPDFFYVSARLQRKHRQYPAHRKPAPSWRHTACPVNELSKSAAYTMTRSDAHQASTTAPPPPGLTG